MAIYYAHMTYTELIRHFGTEAAAGAAIKGSRQMVHNWGAEPDKPIPLDKQLAFEEVTNGVLRANLSPELRRVLARKVAA
jgi:hypothetical protein